MEIDQTAVTATEMKSHPIDSNSSSSKKRSTIESTNEGQQIAKTEHSLSVNNSNDTRRASILKFVSTLTVEPYIFFYMFSFMLHTIAQKTLTMEKGCRHELGYPIEVCNNLTFYTTAKSRVESIANDYGSYGDFIRYIPGTLVVIYIGSWSDKYGRKPPIIFALVGAILEDIALILNAFYYEAPVAYFLLASVPGGLTGGLMCVLSTTFSLATEQAPEKWRSLKFAIVQLGTFFGMSLGSLAGGFLSTVCSYTVLFSISAAGHAVAMLWVLTMIAETRKQAENASWREKLRDFFRVQHVVEGFRACLKKRPNNGRLQLSMILASDCCLVVTYTSLADIAFIYTYHRYNWNNEQFSIISTIFDSTGVILTLLSVPLIYKVFKMEEPLLGLIGTVSMLVKNLCLAFAAHLWLYYLGNSLGLFTGLAPLALRSRLSKLLHKDELGKIFAFMAACESLVPSIASIMVTKLYNATMNTLPGAAFLPASVLLLLPIGTMMWMILRDSVTYKHLEGENMETETPEPKVTNKWEQTHPRF